MKTNNFKERNSVMKTWSIPLQRIKLDQTVQPRAELDGQYTEELVNELKNGRMFPPVVVFHDLEDYWLADGFHRYVAHQQAGLGEIKAVVRKGGKREAILHSVSANATHGKRRTNADKRKVVLTLLLDEDWSRWTDRHIAGLCRVSQPFVGTIRKELTDNGYKFPKKRTATNGRKMNVTRIGSNRGSNLQQPKASGKRALSSDGHRRAKQKPETAARQIINDPQTLKSMVAELQAALQEKDRIIEKLETKIWALENENAYSKAVA